MEVMIDSLPGFPDGVSLAEDGNFWITLAAPNQPFVKVLPYRCVHLGNISSWPAASAHPLLHSCHKLHQHLTVAIGTHILPSNAAAP